MAPCRHTGRRNGCVVLGFHYSGPRRHKGVPNAPDLLRLLIGY